MPRAQVIEPTRKPLKTEDDFPHNVCAYCRVSTDEDDQRNSLASQKQFFENFFSDYPNWTKAGRGVFADEGLSGTSLEKRDAFNEMIDLARYGGVDLILTKEVSRFSRNVQHLLNVVEELRNRGIYIWFLSDDINTEKPDYRERLTQIATNAEQESLRTSRRVKWGQQQQMQKGVIFGRKEMYGYNIVKDASGKQHFEIIEEEAQIIKQIFEWFAAGDGTFTIARRLQEMGVKTKRYKNGWSNTVILRLLRNEKYVGDLSQGKTYTPDPLTHKKKYNRGEYYRFYIKDHHPESAIVDRETWDKVQALLKEKEPSEEVKAKHNNRYWTSGKVFCGLCGERYVSLKKKQKNTPYKAWVCFNNHQRGLAKQITDANGEVQEIGCNGKRVNERVLKTALYDIVTLIIKPQKEEICESILAEMRSLDKPKDNKKQIASAERMLKSKSDELQNLTIEYIKKVIPEIAYKPLVEKYNNEIAELQAKIQDLRQSDTDTAMETRIYTECIEQIERLASLSDSEINEGLYERITRKIVVYPNNLLEFHLSFMTRPIYLQYSTSGKGDFYKIKFDALPPERFAELLRNAPKNEYTPHEK